MIISKPQELKNYLSIGKPVISFDYGTSKIGSALTTPDHRLCLPYKIIRESNFDKQVMKVLEMIEEVTPCLIVIGLPLNMDGTKGEQCNLCEKFASNIEKSCNLPLYMQDERLTSKAADNL